MSSTYQIFPLEKEVTYTRLIIATDYAFELTDCFSEMGDPTPLILVDLVLINGVSDNRYVKVMPLMAGQQIQEVLVVPANEVPESIKQLSRDFFKQNPDVLSRGVLPEAAQYCLSQGLI